MNVYKLKRLRPFFLAAVSIFCLVSCASLNSPKDIELTKDSNEKTIKAKVDDQITIRLKGNATTGYTWILKQYDENLLKFIDVKYVPADSALVGSGGEWVAEFKVLKPGISQIQFIYKRPWETKKDPLENYFVTIDASKHKFRK